MSSDCRLIIFLFALFYAFTASNVNLRLLASSSGSSRYSLPSSASQWLQQYHSMLPSSSSRSQVTPYRKSVYIRRPSNVHNENYYHNSGYNTNADFDEQQLQQAETQQYNSYPIGYDLSERFDDEEDYKKHHKVEHHEEAKEISLVYPVLLALLILGALFCTIHIVVLLFSSISIQLQWYRLRFWSSNTIFWSAKKKAPAKECCRIGREFKFHFEMVRG